VAGIATTVGFGWGLFTLHKDYDWRRQQFALNMLAEWNRHTAEKREIIHRHYRRLLHARVDDGQTHDDSAAFTHDAATALYNTTDPQQLELRRAMIEVLNYCEYIAVAYCRRVADPEIVKASIVETISDWYVALAPLIAVRYQHRRRDPWSPLTAFMRAHGHPAAKAAARAVELALPAPPSAARDRGLATGP